MPAISFMAFLYVFGWPSDAVRKNRNFGLVSSVLNLPKKTPFPAKHDDFFWWLMFWVHGRKIQNRKMQDHKVIRAWGLFWSLILFHAWPLWFSAARLFKKTVIYTYTRRDDDDKKTRKIWILQRISRTASLTESACVMLTFARFSVSNTRLYTSRRQET